uniref:Uncharacterized protein n=1 Tax=Cacopsylla melanoneura TaxID=428564 RepID=A0A8D9E762_9HEMI
MVKLNQTDLDTNKRADNTIELKKSVNTNNGSDSEHHLDAMSNEPQSSNEDEDVYLNVSFNNNKTNLNNYTENNQKTNSGVNNNHKTFSKKDGKHVNSSVTSVVSMSDGNCSNTPEGSSDEIYENYCTSSTNGLPSLVKVETTHALTNNSNNSKTFTKHSKISRRPTLDKFELKLEDKVNNIVITSPSCSEFETTSSDDPREGTKSPEDDIANENEEDETESLYENIETIREAMNKGKTYKKNTNANAVYNGYANDSGNKINTSFANTNGKSFNNSATHGNTINNNNFANDNLLVINERKLDKDSLDRKSSSGGGGGVSGGGEREDKANGKGKRDRSSKAR